MIPHCKEHPEQELRYESDHRDLYTAFCPKCPKHYPRCRNVRYMAMCENLEGHDGPHHSDIEGSWTTGNEGNR